MDVTFFEQNPYYTKTAIQGENIDNENQLSNNIPTNSVSNQIPQILKNNILPILVSENNVLQIPVP